MQGETDEDIFGDVRTGLEGTAMQGLARSMTPHQTKDAIAWVRVLQNRATLRKP